MKGWLDNFGKADNANESNVSLPEDFVGLAYNTKGRNYSPAWGGQFQKGGNLFMQQTMDVVQPPSTVPYLTTKDPAEFYKAWIQNPEYARRQLLTGYSSGEDLYMPNAAASRESRLGALEEMTPITYSTRQPSKASPGVYGSPSYVNINPLDYIDTSKEAIEAHELAHIAGAMGEVRPGMMSAKEQEIFKKSMLPVKEPVLSGVQGSKEREASKRALEDWKHSQEPDEAKADLDALRFMMYDKGIYDITKGKKFTEADFEKAKQSLGKDRVFKRLTDRVGKKNFVNLMNVIAKGDEDLTPIAMNGASMPGAVGFTYSRVAGAAPSKGKYAKKTMASAQNGQEMRFYQNGLDWKPKSMQNGGEEMYEGRLLPEVVVTPYDEQFPFYQSLSNEQKKYINDQGPIGRATRAIATTGKKGQTAQDISTGVEDVYRFLADYSAIPGTIRFAKDPINKLKSFERSLFNTAVSSSPFLPTTPYDPKDIQGTFDVLDATGMGAMMAAPLIKPAGAAARMAGKAVAPHMISVSNVANETLDAIQEINRLKQFEKIATADVPLVQGVDKVKDIRNFGRDIFDLSSQAKNVKQSEVNTFLERLAKLDETAKQLETAGLKPYADDLNSISDRLNDLKGYKHNEFIEKVKSLGADEDTVRILENDPDLASHYARQISHYDDARMANELNSRSILRGVQDSFSNTQSKSSTFSPRPTTVGTINDINPITGEIIWKTSPEPLKKIDNKIYVDSGGWRNDEFYSYPFYKNVGDKITDLYANLRLSNSPIVPNVENQFDAIELIPNLSASKYNVGSVLRQASRYIDETPDGLFIPAGSLSGDSYPLSLQMMARELKNNPDAQLRLLGFQKSNQLGFSDMMDNPKVLASELSQILKDLEKTTGQTLPSPFVSKHPTWDEEAVVFPKFGVSKGKANQIIDDYMKNASIAEKVGVKRPVYEVSNIPGPPRSLWGTFQNGGQLKFNPLTNEYELPEVVVEGKDERIKNAMSQGMANFYGHVGELMSAPQKEMMQLITGKEQTPSQAFGFQNTGGWLDSPTSFGKNLLNTGLDFGLDPLNVVGVGLADDVFKLGIRNVGKNLTENLGKGIGKRAISQSPSPQMFSDDLGKIEVPNVSKRSDLEGTGFDQDKLYHLDLFEKKKQQVIDRLSTKKGRERLQRFINENYKKNPEAFGTNILELKNPYLEFLKTGFKDYKKFTPDQIIDNVKNLQFFESGDPLEAMFNYSVKNNNRKFGLDTQSPFGISVGESFTPYDALHILEHELGHFFQRVNKSNVDEILSKLELDDQAKNFELNRPKLPLEDAGFSQTIKKNAFTNAKASRNYFTAGTKGREKMPFLAEVRENLLQRGLIDDYYDDITPEILKKHKDLYDKTGGNKYILRLYEIMKDSPENFNILSNAINKMPQVALPIAGGAAATISALQNQQPVQKQKNGGITKDNLGYWNPNNWGKPVEIDSNIITMEGVNQPLLGISDTGDKKLMKPGKNYKFKGKKVTEFPVAELGINQLDAYPMKKLNQLLNFTNNPDKDNWLDKYN